MVEVGVHRIVGGTRAFVEPALGDDVLTVVDHSLVVDLCSMVLIGLGLETGDVGVDIPDKAVIADVDGVDGFPHAGGIGEHHVGTDDLEEGRLEFGTLLAVGSLVVGAGIGRPLCPC